MHTIEPMLLSGDIPEALLEVALDQSDVAWDIETSGLDWMSDHLATCQLAIANEIVLVQLAREEVPQNLSRLLASSTTRKVFHHAPFDLRFMSYQWHVRPTNVACTKIAAKITTPGQSHDAYSLRSTLRTNLGIEIDKTERMSDWGRIDLSLDQKMYAARDVAYLVELLRVLESRALSQGTARLLSQSFQYLPTRVELDLMGVQDVFSY